MPKINDNKLVNRQAVGTYQGKIHQRQSGLLKKGAKSSNGDQPLAPAGKIDRIAPALVHLTVEIDSLTPDPINARLHPERNMEAIKTSLSLYGQVKPLVVKKKGLVVVAGNGTLEAAKSLGWTKIAAAIVDMSEVDAAGYGLADNRTAELAKWDFEVVARIDRLLQEAHVGAIGWSADELEVLRAADWTPPPISEDGEGEDVKHKLELTSAEWGKVSQALAQFRKGLKGPDKKMSDGACTAQICEEWATKNPRG